MQKQIAFSFMGKAGDRTGIKGDAFFKSTGKLLRKNGNVFLDPEYIEKGKPDEFDIFLFDEGEHIFLRIHKSRPPVIKMKAFIDRKRHCSPLMNAIAHLLFFNNIFIHKKGRKVNAKSV